MHSHTEPICVNSAKTSAEFQGPIRDRSRLASLYPAVNLTISHLWGTRGWQSVVRAKDDAALLAVLLDGNVVWQVEYATVDRAITALGDVERMTARFVSRLFSDRVSGLMGTPVDAWSEEEWEDFLDARWAYQAFTGLHVNTANALAGICVTYETLYLFTRTSPLLRDALVDALLNTDILTGEGYNDLWAVGRRAAFASWEDFEALFLGRKIVPAPDVVRLADALDPVA